MVMLMYSEIKSQYVKSRIKGRKFSQRKYIDDLARLERLITKGPAGWADGVAYHYLRNEYPTEWKAIYKELNSKEFKQIKQREARKREKERKEQEKWEEEEKKEMERKRGEWAGVGGNA